MVASPLFQIFHLGKRAESHHMNRHQFHLGNRASPVNRAHMKRPIVDSEVQRIVEKLQRKKGNLSPVAFQHTFIESTIDMYMLVGGNVSIPFRQFPVYQSDLREKRRAN